MVRASGDAELGRYVVTEDLRRNFHEALGMIGHAVTSGRSQASFLHSHAAAPETSLADLCEHGVITRSLLAVYLPCSERVEPRGLEPLTPTLPVWCATNCATAPSARRVRAPGQ